MAAFLYATRALKAPAFAFPWLQLASDRRLMPRLLGAPAHRGWGAYLQLILVQLRFLEPFLRNAELTDAVRLPHRPPAPGRPCGLGVGCAAGLHSAPVRCAQPSASDHTCPAGCTS